MKVKNYQGLASNKKKTKKKINTEKTMLEEKFFALHI